MCSDRDSGCSQWFRKRYVMCAAPVFICLRHKQQIVKLLNVSLQKSIMCVNRNTFLLAEYVLLSRIMSYNVSKQLTIIHMR